MPSERSLPSIQLDVSDLEPPEPLLAIFKALIELPSGHCLAVKHRRQPFPLFGMLDQTGYHYQCQPVESSFLIYIWPGNDARPQTLAQLVAQAPACS